MSSWLLCTGLGTTTRLTGFRTEVTHVYSHWRKHDSSWIQKSQTSPRMHMHNYSCNTNLPGMKLRWCNLRAKSGYMSKLQCISWLKTDQQGFLLCLWAKSYSPECWEASQMEILFASTFGEHAYLACMLMRLHLFKIRFVTRCDMRSRHMRVCAHVPQLSRSRSLSWICPLCLQRYQGHVLGCTCFKSIWADQTSSLDAPSNLRSCLIVHTKKVALHSCVSMSACITKH